MSDLTRLRMRVTEHFHEALGETPLAERVQDILARAAALNRCTDLDHLRDETGALLCSLLKLCTECGWEPERSPRRHWQRPKARPDNDGRLNCADQTMVRATGSSRRVAIFASTFEPASLFHRTAAASLLQDGFDEVIVCPTGPRPGKGEPEHAATVHRAALTDLTFRDLPGARVDLTDLDEGRFCQPKELETRHRSSGETWHVVGADMVAGGRDGRAHIQVAWENGGMLWNSSRFLVLHSPTAAPESDDLPPVHKLIPLDGHVPSAEFRPCFRWPTGARAADSPCRQLCGAAPPFFVVRAPPVRAAGGRWATVAHRLRRAQPCAAEIAARYSTSGWKPAGPCPGGRRRRHHVARHSPPLAAAVSFVGLNAGHLGFLMNERLPHDLNGLDLVSYALPMLRVDAEMADGRLATGRLAYGDVWLERDGGQAAWLRLDVDGQTRVPKVVGDGLLVSTAAGSSAYARAIGAVRSRSTLRC